MSKKKTIFDLFREKDKDSGFSDQPSAKAWDRLENRLDGKPEPKIGGGRMIRMNFFAIAASLAVLLGFGALFFIQSTSMKETRSFAYNDSVRPVFVEHLVLSDSDPQFEKEWRISNEYRSLFEENVPNNNAEYREEAIADVLKKIQPNRINQKPGETIIAMSDESFSEAESEELTDRIQKDLMSKMNDYNATESINADSGKSNSHVSSIAGLNWLEGNWEQKMPDLKSVEKWVADTFGTISGTGYLVQGDDTVFTEKMVIKQIGDKVYFFQSPDYQNEQIPFVMTVQSDSQWVFENRKPDGFSEQLILSVKNNRQYQYELKNTESLDEAYLRRRNAVFSNSAKRNMVRLN